MVETAFVKWIGTVREKNAMLDGPLVRRRLSNEFRALKKKVEASPNTVCP